VRQEERRRIAEIKRRRRVEVDPFAPFHFENYDTMRHQVQEILYIEMGATLSSRMSFRIQPTDCAGQRAGRDGHVRDR
jgi:hypothetical protein